MHSYLARTRVCAGSCTYVSSAMLRPRVGYIRRNDHVDSILLRSQGEGGAGHIESFQLLCYWVYTREGGGA